MHKNNLVLIWIEISSTWLKGTILHLIVGHKHLSQISLLVFSVEDSCPPLFNALLLNLWPYLGLVLRHYDLLVVG